MVLCHLTKYRVLLITEFDSRRTNTTNAVFEFNNSKNLPVLSARMTSTKRACVDNLAPLLPTVKISELTIDFAKARRKLNIYFSSSHYKPSFCCPRRTSMQSQSTVAASTFIAESII